MMTKIFISTMTILSLNSYSSEKTHFYKIRWLLAHEPIGLFKEAAEVFSKEVSSKTNNEIQVEVLTVSEFEAKYNHNKKMRIKEVSDYIQDGRAEMSQTYTTDLGNKYKKMWVLDLPFLFKDHDHAQAVLEGKIGESLLAGLRNVNIEGLAFTYSGGYRVTPGARKLEKLSDFKGVKIRTSTSPVAQETFRQVGATPVPMPLSKIEQGILSNKIEVAELTFPRFFALGQNNVAKIVNETNHSLFLTSIIVNEDFYKKLPVGYKKIVKEAAIKAARIERKRSIETGEEVKKECEHLGIQIVKMNQDEVEKFKNATKPVYKKYENMLSKELISSIVEFKQ